MTQQPLVLRLTRGRAPRLATPVPSMCVVTLPVLSSIALREWLIVLDNAQLTICGHYFDVLGWVDDDGADPGLLLAHSCAQQVEEATAWE